MRKLCSEDVPRKLVKRSQCEGGAVHTGRAATSGNSAAKRSLDTVDRSRSLGFTTDRSQDDELSDSKWFITVPGLHAALNCWET